MTEHLDNNLIQRSASHFDKHTNKKSQIKVFIFDIEQRYNKIVMKEARFQQNKINSKSGRQFQAELSSTNWEGS